MREQKTRDSIADKILSKLLKKRKVQVEEIDFTPEQQEYFNRLVFLDNLYRQHYPLLNRNQMWKIYHARFGIKSKTTFYADEINCQKIFGTLHTPNKDYMRQLLSERLNFIYTLALNNGDLKTAERATSQQIELHRLHLPDVEMLERPPTRVELNLSFNLGDGKSVEKIINIDEFQNIPISELTPLMAMIDRPRVGVEEMKKFLEDE